jgi:hypothetical protein
MIPWRCQWRRQRLTFSRFALIIPASSAEGRMPTGMKKGAPQALRLRLSACSAHEYGSEFASPVEVGSAGALPSAITATIRGDTKASGAKSRTWRSRMAPSRASRVSGFRAGLPHDGIVAPFVLNGAMNGASFLAYLEQCLVPTLEVSGLYSPPTLSAADGRTSDLESKGWTHVGHRAFAQI